MGNKELELTAALSTLYRGGPELFRKKNEPNIFCPKNLVKCQVISSGATTSKIGKDK